MIPSKGCGVVLEPGPHVPRQLLLPGLEDLENRVEPFELPGAGKRSPRGQEHVKKVPVQLKGVEKVLRCARFIPTDTSFPSLPEYLESFRFGRGVVPPKKAIWIPLQEDGAKDSGREFVHCRLVIFSETTDLRKIEFLSIIGTIDTGSPDKSVTQGHDRAADEGSRSQIESDLLLGDPFPSTEEQVVHLFCGRALHLVATE
jgi:hypothetical protein